VRAALENAGLRMTGLGGRSGGDGTFSNFRTKNLETVPSVPEIPRNPQRLKPRSSEGASRGAEAPLFHGISGGRACALQDQNQRQRTRVSAPHEQSRCGTSELVPFPSSRLAALVESAVFAVEFRFFRFSSGFAGGVRRGWVYRPPSGLSLARTACPVWQESHSYSKWLP
jgi:hypothetical protein